MTKPPRRRIRPLDAWQAIRALLRDPDDTRQVFKIVDALSGKAGERIFRRFRATASGTRILEERRDLLQTLCQRDALAALPPGSLGRSYLDFVTREQITADGLVAASMEAREQVEELSEDYRRTMERLRDMHDLWHVVAGYGRDLVGEASLLAFTFAQTWNPGVGFIVAVAYLRLGDVPGARGLLREAFRRGRRAAWLPGEDWEALLALPLDEVRSRVRTGKPPRYEAVRSTGAPTLAY
ncbi:MAG TPA: Coq4 family protein [Myxococcota bacterium]|nr:Coq4 family protein [Myxococcota bacterium]